MHAKTWILDKQVVVTGSANATNGSFHRNKEHLLVLSNAPIVEAVAEDFEETWVSPETSHVTEVEIAKMMEKAERAVALKDAAREKAREERGPSRSRSKSCDRASTESQAPSKRSAGSSEGEGCEQ